MIGPIRFIFAVLWFAIGLAMIGTLKDCTVTMVGRAANAQQHEAISYQWWNSQLSR